MTLFETGSRVILGVLMLVGVIALVDRLTDLVTTIIAYAGNPKKRNQIRLAVTMIFLCIASLAFLAELSIMNALIFIAGFPR